MEFLEIFVIQLLQYHYINSNNCFAKDKNLFIAADEHDMRGFLVFPSSEIHASCLPAVLTIAYSKINYFLPSKRFEKDFAYICLYVQLPPLLT